MAFVIILFAWIFLGALLTYERFVDPPVRRVSITNLRVNDLRERRARTVRVTLRREFK